MISFSRKARSYGKRLRHRPAKYPGRRDYEKNLAVVQAYLNAHPNLTGLAQLVNTAPDTAPGNPNGMIAWPNDGYQVPIVDKLGRKHSVQLLGQKEKIAEIAGAIQAASDPKTQLQVYTAVLEKIPQSYLNTNAGRDLLQPSQLEGASLATIQSALKQVAKQADNIIQTIPFAGTIPAASCADEHLKLLWLFLITSP